jgi:hypothetical protein
VAYRRGVGNETPVAASHRRYASRVHAFQLLAGDSLALVQRTVADVLAAHTHQQHTHHYRHEVRP